SGLVLKQKGADRRIKLVSEDLASLKASIIGRFVYAFLFSRVVFLKIAQILIVTVVFAHWCSFGLGRGFSSSVLSCTDPSPLHALALDLTIILHAGDLAPDPWQHRFL